MKTINLQNTPELKGVSSEAVSFDSNGAPLKGILYMPKSVTDALTRVIVADAWITVKE